MASPVAENTPEASGTRTANGSAVDPNADLKLADLYVTDSQVSGIVDNTIIEKKKKKTQYSFVVFVVWSDGHTTTVWRSYSNIFTFQVDLLGKFPEEAGEKADKDGRRPKRIIPFLPGKKLFTRSDAKLAAQREPQIAEWLSKLVHLPEKVSRSLYVVNFFKAKESDPGYVKGNEGSSESIAPEPDRNGTVRGEGPAATGVAVAASGSDQETGGSWRDSSAADPVMDAKLEAVTAAVTTAEVKYNKVYENGDGDCSVGEDTTNDDDVAGQKGESPAAADPTPVASSEPAVVDAEPEAPEAQQPRQQIIAEVHVADEPIEEPAAEGEDGNGAEADE